MGSIQSVAIRFLLRKSNLWNKPLHQIRTDMSKMKGSGIPKDIQVRTEEINGVSCEVFLSKKAKSNRAIIYFHGGGFCLGIYNANREFVAAIAEKSGMNVYMPDYRLAPEAPFPAALEDAIAVYKGILAQGYSENNITIMGDSSGCALALSALLVLKDSGVRMPKAFVCITPVFDLAGTGETFITKAGKDPFRLTDPLGIAKLYIGENNPSSPMLSPLYGDLSGLPAVLIHAGECDVFLSDSIRLMEKVKAVGGKPELKIWRKMWHIFHMQAAIVPEAKKAMDEIYSFLHDPCGQIY